jgi:rRNA processing protein Krr1/Pno1
MTVERQSNGSLLISDIVNGYHVKKVYYFYSKKEAMKLFREYIKKEKAI